MLDYNLFTKMKFLVMNSWFLFGFVDEWLQCLRNGFTPFNSLRPEENKSWPSETL